MNETIKSLVAIAMARGGASDRTAAQNANYFVTAASISQASPVTEISIDAMEPSIIKWEALHMYQLMLHT